jgi:hypothetical protein
MALYDLVIARVKDDGQKLSDPDDYNNAVTAALARYSKGKPRTLVRDLPGTDSHNLALPVEWCPDFSVATALEYPIGSVPADILPPADWCMYVSPTSSVIRLTNLSPAATESVRCTFTALHTEATLPVVDQEAVADLAASICLLQLAAAYGNSTDSTIQADSVDHQSKTDQYRRLAQELRRKGLAALGLDDEDTTPAASVVAAPPKRRNRWGR